jgi:hypothetical protein
MYRIPLLAAVAVCLGCAGNPPPTYALPPGALLDAGAREYQPGDRVLLKSGAEYTGTLRLRIAGGGDPARPVEVTSDGDAPATILAGDGDGICFRDSGVTLRNLILRGSRKEKAGNHGIRAYNDRPKGDKRSGIEFRRLEISGFGRAGILLDGAASDKSDSGFKDVLIEDCRVSDGVHYGIWSNGYEQPRGSWKYPHANITVRGCEVFGIVGDPDKRDNHSGNGIMIGSVDGALIERCVAHGNGARNGSQTGGPVGIWTYCSRKVVIQRCESYANRAGAKAVDGGGFDLDGGVSESVMQYNYSHDNDGAGYLVYSYKDAPHEFRDNVVRFNVSIDDGRRGEYGGISVGHHGDRNLNTLVHHNLVIVSGAPGTRPSALVSAQTEGLKVLNNVFVARKGAWLAGTWGFKAGERIRVAGNTWLHEGGPAALQGLEAAVKGGGDRVVPLKAALDDTAPTCWPRDVTALGEFFRVPPEQTSPVDLDLSAPVDFLGRASATARFAGPFAPK